jgi:hypothetical protein
MLSIIQRADLANLFVLFHSIFWGHNWIMVILCDSEEVSSSLVTPALPLFLTIMLFRELRLQGKCLPAGAPHTCIYRIFPSTHIFIFSCTSDVEFYVGIVSIVKGECVFLKTCSMQTPFNYGRTLTWTAVMTALSHLDPSFASVVSIEAVNEPIMDATQTPGYGDCKSYIPSLAVLSSRLTPSSTVQKNFVRVVRAVELLLSIPVPNTKLDIAITTSNFTAALGMAAGSSIFNSEVKKALADASPILLKLGVQFALKTIFDFKLSNAPFHSRFEPLTTAFMDRSWQHVSIAIPLEHLLLTNLASKNNPPNPADAANGPSLYDNHLYYVCAWSLLLLTPLMQLFFCRFGVCKIFHLQRFVFTIFRRG